MSALILPPTPEYVPVKVSCTVKRDVALSVPNNSPILVDFSAEVSDVHNMFDVTGDASKVIVPAGYSWAKATAYTAWNAILAGERRADILHNLASPDGQQNQSYLGGWNPGVAGVTGSNSETQVFPVVANDFIQLQLYQNSGVAQGINYIWMCVELWK